MHTCSRYPDNMVTYYYYYNGLSLCRFQNTYLLFGFPIHYLYCCTLRSFVTALYSLFNLNDILLRHDFFMVVNRDCYFLKITA